MTRLRRALPLQELIDDHAARRRVDESAPVVSRSRRDIAASVDVVWEVLADIWSWPSWWPRMRVVSLESVTAGSLFVWRLGPTRFTSRLVVVDPQVELTWVAEALGSYRAVDRHVLHAVDDDRTSVTVEESLDGPLLPRLYPPARLEANHEAWLDGLEREARRRSAAAA